MEMIAVEKSTITKAITEMMPVHYIFEDLLKEIQGYVRGHEIHDYRAQSIIDYIDMMERDTVDDLFVAVGDIYVLIVEAFNKSHAIVLEALKKDPKLRMTVMLTTLPGIGVSTEIGVTGATDILMALYAHAHGKDFGDYPDGFMDGLIAYGRLGHLYVEFVREVGNIYNEGKQLPFSSIIEA